MADHKQSGGVTPSGEEPTPQDHEGIKSEIPLYKDKYVDIYSTQLVIHTYFFPTAQKKVIQFEKIQSIRSDKELNLGKLGYKSWGMGLANIWFACNLGRPFDGQLNFIVKVHNDSIRKGFSVERTEEALHALNKVLPGPRQAPQ